MFDCNVNIVFLFIGKFSKPLRT